MSKTETKNPNATAPDATKNPNASTLANPRNLGVFQDHADTMIVKSLSDGFCANMNALNASSPTVFEGSILTFTIPSAITRGRLRDILDRYPEKDVLDLQSNIQKIGTRSIALVTVSFSSAKASAQIVDDFEYKSGDTTWKGSEARAKVDELSDRAFSLETKKVPESETFDTYLVFTPGGIADPVAGITVKTKAGKSTKWMPGKPCSLTELGAIRKYLANSLKGTYLGKESA